MTGSTEAPQPHHLLKILGVGFGVSIAVGEAIGSGILRAPSTISALVPGVGIILGLWILGGVQSLLQANVLAELATALPKSGGSYIYAHRAFGDVAGLVVGWSTWLAKLAGAAAAAVSFAEFLPLLWPSAEGHKIAVALAVQVALYGANIAGLREGRVLQETTSIAKAVMLVAFMVAAVVVAAPIEPIQAWAARPLLGWAGLILAYRLILGAYAGWSAPTFFTGENVSPGASIPRSLFYGVLLTMILYVGVNGALLYALSSQGVASSTLPYSIVLGRIGGPLPALLFALTALVTVASCANANIMGGPRVLLALAEDGLLPKAFAWVNSGGSPVLAFLATAAGTILLAMSGTFALVFGLIATLDTVAAILVEAGYFMLRWREPELERPFRAFGHPVLPILILVLDTALLLLFASSDYVGAAVTVGMFLVCIPLAYFARRG